MIENANMALDCIGGLSVELFSETRLLVYAATRAAQIDPAIRQAMPSLPWRQAIGTRNKLIHGYRSLQPAILYETIKDDFPPLIAEIKRILNDGA